MTCRSPMAVAEMVPRHGYCVEWCVSALALELSVIELMARTSQGKGVDVNHLGGCEGLGLSLPVVLNDSLTLPSRNETTRNITAAKSRRTCHLHLPSPSMHRMDDTESSLISKIISFLLDDS